MASPPSSSSSSSSSPSSPFLPPDFLAAPRPDVAMSKIDFATTPLPEYAGLHAYVLDNALTPSECRSLVRAAEATAAGVWEPAQVNVGMGMQQLLPDVRDCGRIIWDSQAVASAIWARVSPLLLPEMEVLKDAPRVTGPGPAKRDETWALTRPNERMRFLKYGAGQYFRAHRDGCYVTPDGGETSFFTLHLYLNESDPSSDDGRLEGGATVFHYYDEERNVRVEPKVGRILVFQHKHLLHEGEEVRGGLKMTLRTDLMFRRVEEEPSALKSLFKWRS